MRLRQATAAATATVTEAMFERVRESVRLHTQVRVWVRSKVRVRASVTRVASVTGVASVKGVARVCEVHVVRVKAEATSVTVKVQLCQCEQLVSRSVSACVRCLV